MDETNATTSRVKFFFEKVINTDSLVSNTFHDVVISNTLQDIVCERSWQGEFKDVHEPY
ncbi:unnamed protein product [Cercospora beticola]|nr:unnamed protein product [Cercospora beticola]